MMSNDLQIAIYVLIFISTLLIIDAIARYSASKISYKKIKNKRLKILDKLEFGEEALVELRRQRGLGVEGKYVLPIISLNKLILQSGSSIGIKKIFILMLFLGIIPFIAVYYFFTNFIISIFAFVIVGIVFPILWLRIMRNRRR